MQEILMYLVDALQFCISWLGWLLRAKKCCSLEMVPQAENYENNTICA